MANQSHHTHLTKIDHTDNQYQYYSLRVDPDLFGGWTLIHQWGKLETDDGTLHMESFDSEELATSRLAKITQQKRKSSYQ